MAPPKTTLDKIVVAVTTLAVILAAMVTSDGSSNWLLGLCLILTYCLIGVCYFCRTDPED